MFPQHSHNIGVQFYYMNICMTFKKKHVYCTITICVITSNGNYTKVNILAKVLGIQKSGIRYSSPKFSEPGIDSSRGLSHIKSA